MGQPYTVDVTLSAKGQGQTRGVAKVLPRDVGDRAKRALSFAGLCYLVAVPLVLMPPHIPIPATLITVGTVVGILRWRETDSLLSLDAPCPSCQQVGKMKLSGAFRDGKQLHCDACGFMIDLHVAAAAVRTPV